MLSSPSVPLHVTFHQNFPLFAFSPTFSSVDLSFQTAARILAAPAVDALNVMKDLSQNFPTKARYRGNIYPHVNCSFTTKPECVYVNWSGIVLLPHRSITKTVVHPDIRKEIGENQKVHVSKA